MFHFHFYLNANNMLFDIPVVRTSSIKKVLKRTLPLPYINKKIGSTFTRIYASSHNVSKSIKVCRQLTCY